MIDRTRRAARRALASTVTYLTAVMEAFGRLLQRLGGGRRAALGPRRPSERRAPVVADERTMRRIAEAQAGGISSAEAAGRWRRGENPGGIHHKAVRRVEDEADLARSDLDEPKARKERVPGGGRHLPTGRRGA